MLDFLHPLPRKGGGRPWLGPLQGWLPTARPTAGAADCGQGSLQGGGWMLASSRPQVQQPCTGTVGYRPSAWGCRLRPTLSSIGAATPATRVAVPWQCGY
ncbi:hypothetical protein GW17_00022918 [Ensete ventricosum]|nr:hypothetical protein GW17_00022918 [Ensete ventricosum]RZS23717.1 hypothetical protein BHM03_00056695 [Ensete ventricosum]